METYYVNRKEQTNGDHEVHNSLCHRLPSIENRIELGNFYSCKSAVTEAKKLYPQSNGCYYCSSECHTS